MDKKILNSKIYGEGKNAMLLLVLHGLFGMLDNWAGFGKTFGDFFPVHLLDLRNHGRSFHDSEMSLDSLANDIFNYTNFYNLNKINLLGHSLGGKAAMQFAVTFPEKMEKLIVADIAPKAYPPHHQGIIKALQNVDFEKVTTRQEVEESLGKFIKEKSVIQFLMKNLYWAENKQLAWRFNLPVLAEKYSEFVTYPVKSGKFEGKTLFLSGEKSNYILPQDELLISQQFPYFEMKIVKNAGHWLHADNPVDFNEFVKNFLID